MLIHDLVPKLQTWARRAVMVCMGYAPWRDMQKDVASRVVLQVFLAPQAGAETWAALQ